MSIPYVNVPALEMLIEATRKYKKDMKNPSLQDILEIRNYLVNGLGFSRDTANKMCLHPSQIVAQLSQMREVCVLFKELYDKVGRNRIDQNEKRLQLEKELEEAKAQAPVATNVLEKAIIPIPYIPCVDVSALKTLIAATHKYMKKMESLRDILETENYLVHGLGFSRDTASKMCFHTTQIVVHLSQMCEDLSLFKELYDKVERKRIDQHEKRLQLEKELEEAEAQALVATNVLEKAQALVATKLAELEELWDDSRGF
jgi:predicted transcriptional regulator